MTFILEATQYGTHCDVTRKQIKKSVREGLYLRYNRRCGYCGQQIELRDMQIDHVMPLCRGGADDESNYLPACRACNGYKGVATVEEYRRLLSRFRGILERQAAFKAAVRFGGVEITGKPVKFYFEDLQAQNKSKEDE